MFRASLLCLLLSLACAPAIADTESPGETAASFINSYVKALPNLEDHDAQVAWLAKCPLVTEHFRSALAKLYRDAKKADPELGYDSDAVLGGQDYADAYKVQSSKVQGDKARVRLEGTDSPMAVTVILVRGEDGWLVDTSGDLAR